MRQQKCIVQCLVAWINIRLVVVYVQPGGKQLARGQGFNQCVIIDNGATRGIHDHRLIRKQIYALCIYQVMCFGSGRAVDRKKIAMRQQLFHALVIDGAKFEFRRQPAPVVIVNLHVEATRAPGHDLADSAHPQDAQALAGHLNTQLKGSTPFGPGIGANLVFAFISPPGCP